MKTSQCVPYRRYTRGWPSLAILLLQVLPVLAEEQPGKVPQVKATFRPVKKEFVLGEAIKILLEVNNVSNTAIYCHVNTTSSDSYSFELEGKRFGSVKALRQDEGGDIFLDTRKIGPESTDSFYCMVQEFCQIPGPDTYTVVARAVLTVDVFRGPKNNRLPVESRFEIVVRPRDPVYLAKRRQELFTLCNSGDTRTATKAFHEFRYILGDQAIPLLRKLLENDQSSVHYRVIDELARMGSKEALNALAPALRSPQGDVRRHLAQSLWRFGKSSLPLLSRLVNDPDPVVRVSAAGTLTGLDVPEAVAPLSRLIFDKKATVRSAALSGLTSLAGMIQRENAADPLRAKVQTLLAQEKDEEVIKAAKAFLEALAKPAKEKDE